MFKPITYKVTLVKDILMTRFQARRVRLEQDIMFYCREP